MHNACILFDNVIPNVILIYDTLSFYTPPCTQTPHSHPHSPAFSPPVSRKRMVNV